MPTPPYSQILGTTEVHAFTIRNRAQQAIIGVFTEDDVLSASVWRGDDQATLITPTVEWVDPDQGVVVLTITESMISGISPGTYRLQAFVTPQSDDHPRCFLDGAIRFEPTAGTAVPLPVYATSDDMEIYCPQVMKLQDLLVDQANFAQQRHRARTWFDRYVLDHYNPQPGRSRRLINDAGDDFGPNDRLAPPPTGVSVPTKAELVQYLADDKLILTDDIRAVNAHHAASLVYLAQPGEYGDKGGMHQSMASAARYRAVVEIDTNGLGTENIRIGKDVTFFY